MTSTTPPVKAGASTLAYTFAYFAAFVLLGMATSATGPSLPSLAAATGSELGQIGSLFLASSFGYMIGSLNAGRAYDRLRGNVLLAAAIGFTAAMLTLVPLIGSLFLLIGVMFLLGFGEGTMDVGGNLLLVWVHRARAAPYLNGLHFSFGLGAMLIPVIVAQSIERLGGIGPAFWLIALLAVPLAVFTLRLPSPAAPTSDDVVNNGAINWLLVALISIVFFFYVGGEGGYGGWIFTYVTRLKLGDVASAGLLTSAYWGALMAGRLAFIPVAHRFKAEKVIVFDFLACLASVGLILWFPTSLTVIWAGTLLFGFFNGPIFPTLLAYAEQHMTMSGKAARWFFVGTGAGGMFLPWLMGKMFEGIGPASVIWAVLISMAAGLGMFMLVRGLKH